MSMNNYANYGWTIKASELTRFFGEPLKSAYTQLIEDQDWESIENFLSEKMPEGFPTLSNVFLMGDEDESADLDRGEIYVYFDTTDLFTVTPTKELESMKSYGINPVESRWVTWG
jgi:hypothetical protein